jgi:ribonuclease HIII
VLSSMDDGHIGVDESGKGDYFGPLVIAAVYVGAEHLAELEGVRDSKKVTDKQAFVFSSRIKKTCPFAIVAIGPQKYNELYSSMQNLNKILAWGHARAIENVLEKQPATLAISDQFAQPETVYKSLMQKGRNIKLESFVRAESDIAVACASLLARAEFLKRLKLLSDQYEVSLPKGASSEVIKTAKMFVAKHGADALQFVAKLHFKTTKEVLNHLP